MSLYHITAICTCCNIISASVHTYIRTYECRVIDGLWKAPPIWKADDQEQDSRGQWCTEHFRLIPPQNSACASGEAETARCRQGMYVCVCVCTHIIYVHICTAINELLYTVHVLYNNIIYHVHVHSYIQMYIAYSSAVYTVWFMKEPWSVYVAHIRTYVCPCVAYVEYWCGGHSQLSVINLQDPCWPDRHCKNATWTCLACTYVRTYVCT